MLTRRSFLRKAGLAAGAALVALVSRKVPKAEALEIQHDWKIKIDFPQLSVTGPYKGKVSISPGPPVLQYVTADGKAHVEPCFGERPEVWPMREPTEQEYEKWRADLEDMCDQIGPWLEDCVEAAAETARQAPSLFELMVPNA